MLGVKPNRQDLDNAAVESFFSSLKIERTARRMYRTSDDAKPPSSIMLIVLQSERGS